VKLFLFPDIGMQGQLYPLAELRGHLGCQPEEEEEEGGDDVTEILNSSC